MILDFLTPSSRSTRHTTFESKRKIHCDVQRRGQQQDHGQRDRQGLQRPPGHGCFQRGHTPQCSWNTSTWLSIQSGAWYFHIIFILSSLSLHQHMIGTCGTKEQYTTASEDVAEGSAIRPARGYQTSRFYAQGPGHASCDIWWCWDPPSFVSWRSGVAQGTSRVFGGVAHSSTYPLEN